MFLKSVTNMEDQSRIGDTGYRTITLVDTHFQAIISPTIDQIKECPNAYYAAHIFQEYINRKIPPIRNYLLFVRLCRAPIPLSSVFTYTLYNVIGYKNYQKYKTCIARLEQEMKYDSY